MAQRAARRGNASTRPLGPSSGSRRRDSTPRAPGQHEFGPSLGRGEAALTAVHQGRQNGTGGILEAMMAGDVAAVIGAAMAFFLISIAAGMAVIAAPEQRSHNPRWES